MFAFTCSGCGSVTQFDDHLAGRKVRCPVCQAVAVAPGVPTVLPAEPAEALPADLPTVLPAGPPAAKRRDRAAAAAQPQEAAVLQACDLLGRGVAPAEVRARLVERGLDPATAAVVVDWAAARVRQARAPSKLLGVGKIVGGLALSSCFGVGVYGVSYTGGLWAAAVFGVLMGLGFRWILTGAANLIGRRLPFLVSLIPVVLFVIPACLWGPQVSLRSRAEEGLRKKDAEILRDVLRRIDQDHPDDERYAETRARARQGLEDLFQEALAQLDAPAGTAGPDAKAPEFPVDQELRAAFRRVISDLSARGDGTVYVASHNEARLDAPAGDGLALALKRATPEVKAAFPNGDAPVLPAGQAFDPTSNQKRRDTFFKALSKAFEQVIREKGLLVLQPLADGEERADKLVFEVTSVAVREPTYYSYTNQGKVTGLLFGLRVDWEFAVLDRHGAEWYRKKTTSIPAENLSLKSKPSDPDWAPYSVLMDSAYYNYSREVIGRFGLTPPEQRKEFGFAE